MRETIVFAPELQGTEFQKNLALHGASCINMRIVGAAELARTALMRSGVSIQEDFLDSREEFALIAKAVEGETYFGKTTYSDIREIASAIRLMRSLVTDEDEAKVLEETLMNGIFQKKNAALLRVYNAYRAVVKGINALDSIMVIRKAIAKSNRMDSDFVVLKEYPLGPLEKKLLEKLSGNIYAIKEIQSLYGRDSQAIRVGRYLNCYGAPNEVETILADIYSGKSLDQCMVAVADSATYSQLFFDYALLHDIPITFGCGIPAINSNPAKLLMLYYRWITSGFYGTDALTDMLSSNAFDRKKLLEQFGEGAKDLKWKAFCKILGSVRLTTNSADNARKLQSFKAATEEELKQCKEGDRARRDILLKLDYYPYLTIAAKQLSRPPEEFIAEYSHIRMPGKTESSQLLMRLDYAAMKSICDELTVIHRSGLSQTTEDVLLAILKKNVCTQSAEAGKLHVTDIAGALSEVRNHLYIAGMSANVYPGSPRENYLLLDEDLRLFGQEAEEYLSISRITRKKERLIALVRLASALESDVVISYAGMNVSELKKQNASSLLYELYRMEHGSHATAEELDSAIYAVDYFELAISPMRGIGTAYTNECEIQYDEPATKGVRAVWTLEKEYSPSALSTFFNCPRQFMLQYIVGVEPFEETDPFTVIPANDAGKLAHSLMEVLGNEKMERDAFLNLASSYFDRYLEQHPPLIAEKASEEKARFLYMMEIAYDTDPYREVVLEEEELHGVHETGVKLKGFPDRVEKLEDGSCLVVDFKTGRTIHHKRDDIDSCLQAVVYAYLMEKNGYQVSGSEFRYPRKGETISCKYDAEMKESLDYKLRIFHDALVTGDFPLAERPEYGGEDPCRYCKYGTICGRDNGEGGDD